MTAKMKQLRRVVTGNDESGKSKVVLDGPAPNTHPGGPHGNGWTNLWIWDESPAPLGSLKDGGDLPYAFPGPPNGGHLRVVHADGGPQNYDPAKDVRLVSAHEPKVSPSGRMWDRGGKSAYTSEDHKTETVDYAILIEGERNLRLSDCEVNWQPGDVVIQVGAYHQWASPNQAGLVAFDMIAARFVDGSAGLAQGHDPVMTFDSSQKLPGGVTPPRRIVTIDREEGKSTLVSDGPTPDIRFDPARPGFSSSRMWVTDKTPASIVFETLHLPHTIEPPVNGSVLRMLTIPPDDTWKGKVGIAEVKSYFQSMGSPQASTYTPTSPHLYMQKTRSLDFVIIVKGEIVLVLDAQEVVLKAGDFVIQRGTNHAWSNRSSQPALLAIASHDAR